MRVAYFLPKDLTLPRYDGDIRIDMMRAAGLEVTEISIDYLSMDANRAVASRQIAEILTKASPEILHLEGGSFSRAPWLASILGEWKRTLGVKVTLWYGDVRGESLTPLLRNLAPHVDLFLTSNGGLLDLYRKAGYPRVVEQHMSVDGSLYGPFGEPQFDLVFVGNFYGGTVFPLSPERGNLLKRLDQEFKLLIRGRGWTGFKHAEPFKRGHPDVGRFYARAKIAVGINHWDVANYYPERLWQGLASGRTYLTRYIPKMERDFVLGHHLETFHTIDEAVEKVKDLLKDGRWRKVGAAGRAIFEEKHTWRHRFERYARLIKELK